MRYQLTSLLTTLVVSSFIFLSSALRITLIAKSTDYKSLGRALAELASQAKSDGFTIEGSIPLPVSKNLGVSVYGQKLMYILPKYLIAFLRLGSNMGFSVSGSTSPSRLINEGM